MNKPYHFFGAIALILALSLPATIHAQSIASDNAQSPTMIRSVIRQKVRSVENGYQNGLQNIKNNQESRNNILLKSQKSIRPDIYKQYVDAIDGLSIAVANLHQVGERVSLRIQKDERGGKDMAVAKDSMSVFSQKIFTADQALSALLAYSQTSTSTLMVVNSIVIKDLNVLRQNYDDAVRSINDAKLSLEGVIQAIVGSGVSSKLE
ncbi:MAG: hypothetical protein NTZ38_02075 [Candidatus Taylorbacteria bacterium]|nr:hypothetical protein [Candidatus Taylorbacteria bacterium]